MKEMIYGIGPYPIEEDDEFSIGCPQIVVFVTDLETWEKHQACNDWIDKDIRKMLNDAGFVEMEDGIFEPTDIKMTEKYIDIEMTKIGFVRNKEFEDFMIDVWEG